jgi:hypothetical protein
MEVKAAGGADFEVALEVIFPHRVAARITFAEEPLAEGLLLGGVDSCLGLGELGHGKWLA